VPVEILVRGKDAEENKKQFQSCLETIKKAGVSAAGQVLAWTKTDDLGRK